MKEKIKKFIDYEFRNIPDSKEVQSAKLEAFQNLSDTYEAYIEQGMESNEAYIQAINNLGDFTQSFKETEIKTHHENPQWQQTLFVIGLVSSIFSVPIILLSTIIGSLILLNGMTTFFVSAYFYIKKAKYILEHEKDVDGHNQMLKNAYGFYHKNRLPWLFSSSYLLASAITSLSSSLLITIVFHDPLQITDFDIILFTLFTTIFLFVVIFIVMLIVLSFINHKIKKAYIQMTGDHVSH